jgi:hypothetical protein
VNTMTATNENVAAREDDTRQVDGDLRDGKDVQAFLLRLLRVATLRIKLDAVDLHSISIALKQGLVSLDGAVAWLEDLGLFEFVIQQREPSEGGRQ